MPVLPILDLVVGTNAETRQVVGYSEEQNKLHVDKQITDVGWIVKRTSDGAEYGACFKSEEISKYEPKNCHAYSKHDHELGAVNEDLADFEDFDLPPLEVEEEESEGKEEETLANIPKHQTVNQWECENHEGRRVRLRVCCDTEVVDDGLERSGPS